MNDALKRLKLARMTRRFRQHAAEAENARSAAVTGSTDLPIADRAREWDGDAATRRVFELYTDDSGEVDTDAVSRAFLWRDDDADPATQSAYSLGFADVIDGTLTMIPRGVAATAGGRGVDATDIPADAKERIRTRICGLYSQIRDEYEDWPDCPFDDGDQAASAADDEDE